MGVNSNIPSQLPSQLIAVNSVFYKYCAQDDENDADDYEKDMDNIIRNSSPDERNGEIWKYIEKRMRLCADQAKEELESSEEYQNQLDAQIDLLSM